MHIIRINGNEVYRTFESFEAARTHEGIVYHLETTETGWVNCGRITGRDFESVNLTTGTIAEFIELEY